MRIIATFVPALAVAMMSSAAWAQQPTIKIGSVLALTGPGAAIATSAQEGIRYAVDQANAAGGLEVNGTKYKLEYISYDDQLKPAEAVSAYSRLVERDKVKYIFTMISASHLALKSKIEEDDVFVMTSAVSDKAIEADTKHVVRIQTLVKDYMPPLIAWMRKNMKGEKIVRIYPNDESGRLFEKLTDKSMQKVGYKASTEFVERQAEDFAPVLTKILASPPDLIDMGPTSPATSALIVRQARELGYKGQFVLLGGWGTARSSRQWASRAPKGWCICCSRIRPTRSYQALADFYQKKYNAPPNELIVNFYDGAAIMLKAIQRKSPDEPQKARAAMPSLFPFKSLQGQTLTYGGKASIGTDAQVFSTNYIAVMKDSICRHHQQGQVTPRWPGGSAPPEPVRRGRPMAPASPSAYPGHTSCEILQLPRAGLPARASGKRSMIPQMIVNGVLAGFIYVIMALGFTMVFGIMRIVNFAHGEFYMIGALVVLVLFGRMGWPFFAAAAAGGVLSAAFGVVAERILYRPLVGEDCPA